VGGAGVDTRRVRSGELIAAVASVVLFISLFLEWYSVKSKGISGFGVGSFTKTGWQSLGKIDFILAIIAVAVVAVAVARAMGTLDRMSPAVTPGFIVFALGAVAVLLVLIRLLNVPGGGLAGKSGFPLEALPGIDISRSYGVYIAFLAAIGVAVGGWMSWTVEGRPLPGDETRRRGSSREMPPP
jgi:hypothetical protein